MNSGDDIAEAIKKKLAEGGGKDDGALQDLIDQLKGKLGMLGGEEDGQSLGDVLEAMKQKLEGLNGDGDDEDGSLAAALEQLKNKLGQLADGDGGGGKLQSAIQGMLGGEDDEGDGGSPWSGIGGGVPKEEETPALGDIGAAIKDAMQGDDASTLHELSDAVKEAMQQPGDEEPTLQELSQAVKDAMQAQDASETAAPSAEALIAGVSQQGADEAGQDASSAVEEQKDLMDAKQGVRDSLAQSGPATTGSPADQTMTHAPAGHSGPDEDDTPPLPQTFQTAGPPPPDPAAGVQASPQTMPPPGPDDEEETLLVDLRADPEPLGRLEAAPILPEPEDVAEALDLDL